MNSEPSSSMPVTGLKKQIFNINTIKDESIPFSSDWDRAEPTYEAICVIVDAFLSCTVAKKQAHMQVHVFKLIGSLLISLALL